MSTSLLRSISGELLSKVEPVVLSSVPGIYRPDLTKEQDGRQISLALRQIREWIWGSFWSACGN
jgi:hypothetical protein